MFAQPFYGIELQMMGIPGIVMRPSGAFHSSRVPPASGFHGHDAPISVHSTRFVYSDNRLGGHPHAVGQPPQRPQYPHAARHHACARRRTTKIAVAIQAARSPELLSTPGAGWSRHLLSAARRQTGGPEAIPSPQCLGRWIEASTVSAPTARQRRRPGSSAAGRRDSRRIRPPRCRIE
jgi:hypothetical protein